MAATGKDKPDDGWAPTPAGGAGRAVTPLEIQQKEFAVARFGGYKMRDVDEFLDELTESVSAMVAENERLRRQAGADPVVGAPDLDDVSRQADEIIQRARDEASRIVAEANERAASTAGALAVGGPAAASAAEVAAVQAFLSREREFLQSLAALVQGHVESVKGMARTAPKAEAPRAEEIAIADEADDARVEPMEATERADPAEGADGSRPDDPEARADEPDVDVTQVMTGGEEPIRVDEPQRAGAPSRDRDEGDDSLRELFWGEEG